MVSHTVKFNDDGTAEVTAMSVFTGKMHTVLMTLTYEQHDNWYSKGIHIQNAMPHLSACEREFFLTGATGEEWNAMFKPEHD